ncbi:MAG TPA: CBS domain-containing protein [Gemmatimonadaceae bacterium]|jgi:CBS domain-containing protein|nr:CBS domain-containing protein [Gemmatimonadaceae bacterium]
MKVAELMLHPVQSVSPDMTVAELVRVMADAHVSGLPVVDRSARIVGVVTATDVLQAAAEKEDERARATLFQHSTAADLMTRTVLTIEPDADVRHAAQQMLYTDVRRLFVVEKERLVGVISQTDIAQAMGAGRL